MRIIPSSSFAILALSIAVWSCTDRETGDMAILRKNADGHLRPGAFADLPASIRSDLERRGCTIPQTYPDSTPHNVIRGRFTSRDQMDVAVLCAVGSTMTILVFRGGSADSVAELASQPHVDERIPGDTAGNFWHSRAINSADSAYIRIHFERYGGPKPPQIDHEGINDIFVEKASVVWYWNGSHWLRLQGAD